jgi:YHS domain-containing protein
MQFKACPLAIVVLSLSTVAILVAGCSQRTPPQQKAALSTSPAKALTQVQDAIDRADGYTMAVQQTNFVLPRWGGADGGDVHVGAHGTEAKARLKRTGETNATYAITYAGGTTYFQRSTCQESFQMPGEKVNVLRLYLLAATDAIGHAKDATIDGSTITATLAGLGRATIQVDASTMRPRTITASNASGPVVWIFKDWNGIKVSPPHAATERGPGGIPC